MEISIIVTIAIAAKSQVSSKSHHLIQVINQSQALLRESKQYFIWIQIYDGVHK